MVIVIGSHLHDGNVTTHQAYVNAFGVPPANFEPWPYCGDEMCIRPRHLSLRKTGHSRFVSTSYTRHVDDALSTESIKPGRGNYARHKKEPTPFSVEDAIRLYTQEHVGLVGIGLKFHTSPKRIRAALVAAGVVIVYGRPYKNVETAPIHEG
jgi:hypothetical protein